MSKLFFVFPHSGKPERLNELIPLFLETEPYPEAIEEYTVTAAATATMMAMTGARHTARSFLAQAERLGARERLERDPILRASVWLHQVWIAHALEPDPFRTMTMAREASLAFKGTSPAYYVVLSRLTLGSSEVHMGDIAGGEATLRRAFELATRRHEPFLVLSLSVHLALALSIQREPSALDEGARLALSVIESEAGPIFIGVSHIALATILLAQGRAEEAEENARKARALCASMPPYSVGAFTPLIRALLRQGRVAEACAFADEGLGVLAALGGAGWNEVPLREAAVSAWYAAEEPSKAGDLLREALHQIEVRSSSIPDPAWLERFLTGRPENVRLFALAEQRLGQEGLDWIAKIRRARL